jgi:AraC family transcriptional activator FtrA
MERIAAARELLSRGETSIDDIAAAVGFGSAHTLRHHFRQKIGISPAEYRRRFLAETVTQPI